MTSEQWQKVKEVFDAALAVAPSEREEFLKEACAGDAELRREVEKFLASFEETEGLKKDSAVKKSENSTDEEGGKFESGQKLGNFQVLSRIGAGGMGEVFLAEDVRLNRKVALKVLHKQVAANHDRLLRFEREARAVSALNHPNILTIFEFGAEGGTHFLASEFIKGETLRERLNKEHLTIAETLDIAVQIASALQAAHEAGVIHRDIKPENVMIRADGYVKVLDFGLAKLAENAPLGEEARKRMRTQTQAGMVMGTASYMSPEQARGMEIDARTDVFSFGAVMFEMVAGRQLFTGETINHIIVAVLEKEPPPLSNYVRDYPVEIERVIKKCLAKNAGERYQSSKELLADLKRLQRRIEFEAELVERDSASDRQMQTATQTLIIEPDETLAFEIEDTGRDFSGAPPNNLTLNLSPLVGREKEIAEIKDLLRQSDTPLLTMTGIGGTGKTRLSQAVAREMLAEFADGAYFIEMDSITNAELVASTIAQQIKIKEPGGKPVIEILKEYLSNKQILLVIDNFEQVVHAAPIVSELLSSARRLKILVTSRILLRLSIEREYAVPPLALPAAAASLSFNELSKYEAVKLFVERAQNAKPSFALTDENAKSVAEICSRLDGLPLAIELAAARIKILSPPQILTKLENRLQLLTGGARDLPARQQTMRGAVAWSYDLLSEKEKKLFERFSVFVGGFTFEAAEAVGSGESFGDKKQTSDVPLLMLTDVLDGVTSLVDKSLLLSKEQEDGEMRFRMLQVVREFAAETLEKSGEAEATHRSHAVYFLALGEEAEKYLKSERSVKWLNRLEEEHDNIRAALRWLLENDIKSAARLAASVRLFWLLHSHLEEGREWIEAVLARVRGDATVSARFSLLNILGTLARFQGDYEAARKAYEELLAEGKAADDLWQIAEANSGLGSVAYQQGDFATARKFIEESLAVSRQLNEKYGIAAALNTLGDIARTEGDNAAARPLFEESLMISRELGTKQFVCAILANLGAIHFDEGDLTTAEKRFTEALATAEELGNRTIISLSLDGFAALAAEQGDAECAARLSGAAEQLRESIGYEIEPADLRFRDSFMEKIRSALPEPSLSASFERGRRLKAEEAIALCLEKNNGGDRPGAF